MPSCSQLYICLRATELKYYTIGYAINIRLVELSFCFQTSNGLLLMFHNFKGAPQGSELYILTEEPPIEDLTFSSI